MHVQAHDLACMQAHMVCACAAVLKTRCCDSNHKEAELRRPKDRQQKGSGGNGTGGYSEGRAGEGTRECLSGDARRQLACCGVHCKNRSQVQRVLFCVGPGVLTGGLTSNIEIEGRAAGSNGVYIPADSAARASGTTAVAAADNTVAKVALQLRVKQIQRWPLRLGRNLVSRRRSDGNVPALRPASRR